MQSYVKRRLAMIIVSFLTFTASVALAQDAKQSATGDNLLGMNGLARMVAAQNHPVGYFTVGTDFQFFTASEFLRDGSILRDHSRLINSYSLTYTPFAFLEAAFALHVISDNTTGAGLEEDLQVAVGDPEIALKGSYEIMPGFSVGGLLNLRSPSGAGFFNTSLSATNITVAALGSYRISDAVPLSFHLNVGFFLDGSKNLFDDASTLDIPQHFAAQLSSFNRVITRVGVDYATRYFGPFVEVSIEPFLGSGNPGFGGSPNRVTVGAKGWLGEDRGLQIMAAADIGLTGVGPRAADELAVGDYAFTIPRWNVMFRVSYRFDPFTTKTVVQPGDRDPDVVTPKVELPKYAMITGAITDSRTDKPVWNARIRVAKQDASSLAVDGKTGQYRTFNLPLGKHTVIASADGYHNKELEVEVGESGAKANFTLAPKAEIKPGMLRGTVKSASGGKVIRGATLLIPELDKSLKVKSDGSFEISLKSGEYRVIISARGYRTQRKTLRIAEGETVIHNVEMHR
ncbi:MAG: carboxypeptidase regulatory-like domain-containing protein [Deltaproteobacteria bacterium]|nr:carboxypeptidase regulatory-like domain-containing protein [Deltaproteobacteria bacterium]